MKKNKVLAVVIACVAVIITALVITMAATGKFASLKKHFSDETTTSAPADETTAVQANARPKTAKPAQLVAALIEDCGEEAEPLKARQLRLQHGDIRPQRR